MTSLDPGEGRSGDGEAAAEHAWLRALAGDHEVHVLSAALLPGEVSLEMPARISAEGVHWGVHFPRTLFGRAFAAAWPGPPLDVRGTRTRTRALAFALRRRVEREPADLIVLGAMELASLASVGPAPSALALPRLLSTRYELRAGDAAAGRLRRARWRIEKRRAGRWERRWGRRAAAVGCLRPADRAALETRIGRPVKLLDPADARAIADWLGTIKGLAADGSASALAGPAPTDLESRDDGQPPASATVVLCTCGRGQLLEHTLPGFARAVSEVPGTELLVVEQGPPAASELCAGLGIEAAVVADAGVGASRARNLGARRASGSVVVFADDDCAVPPGWVRDHLRAIAGGADASFGAVEGISRRFETRDGLDPVARRARHHFGSPPWAIGHSANMAVRRDVLLEVGGFDERLGPGSRHGVMGEDAELIVRLLRAGKTIESGVGESVRHLEWRSARQEARNVRAYERGAGAWIGRLMREDPGAALHYLRERLEFSRLAVWGEPLPSSPVRRPSLASVAAGAAALVRGVIFGLRSGSWPRASAAGE